MWRVLPPDETRDRLLAAVLEHVPFDGWSEAAVAAAAADLGIDAGEARDAFPGGPAALVEYHAAHADRQLDAALKEADLRAMRIRARVAHAVRLRLEPHARHREAIRAALPVLATPGHAPQALRSLYRTADTIWFAIGDRTTDFGFYTKRALLAGVYLSTLLYWLDDDSDGGEESWAFLDRRIADVMRVQALRGRLARFRLPGATLLRRLRENVRSGRPASPR